MATDGDDSDLPTKFSRVKIKRTNSPGMKSAGNLTGSSRKVKDMAASLYNLQQKWNKLNMEGCNVINQIANIKLQSVFGREDESCVQNNDLPKELEDHCETLSSVVNKMEKIVKKMLSFAVVFKGLQELSEYQSSSSGRKEDVLFQTWSLDQFESTTLELVSMYSKEATLKRLIKENVCHLKDRNTMMFYSSAWLHQPYIDDTSKVLVESMLIETGHKS